MKTIDLKKAISKKSKRLANMPFIVNFLRKLVHEDEINECIYVNSHLHGIEFADGVMNYFNAEIHTSFSPEIHTSFSPEIKLEGRYIFASNHPLGGLDGVALISAVGQKFKKLRFPVNDFLLEIKNFDPVFIPINKHGGQSKKSIQLINDAYESDNQILIFPAGLASRKIDGKVKDLEWNKHFIQKAIQSQRDVIPVHINGQNSDLFYLIAKIRKLFRIKFNLEMTLLPNEMFMQKGKKLEIKFGEPIPYYSFDKTKTPIQWAEFVKEKVYNM